MTSEQAKPDHDSQNQSYDLVDELRKAISDDDVTGLTRLIEGDVKLHTSDERGWTVVHGAASTGSHKCLQLLIGRVDINAKTTKRETAIFLASANGHHECVQLLISRRRTCEPDVTYNNKSPLIYAAENGHPYCVNVLLDHDADYTIKDNRYKKALEYAKESGNHVTIKLQQSYIASKNVAFHSSLKPTLE